MIVCKHYCYSSE